MARVEADLKAKKQYGAPSHQAKPVEETKTEEKSEVAQSQTKPENVVIFTSYDGAVREVGDLPSNLGRATALASEKSVSKVWGTSEEEAACHVMQREI